MNKLLVSLIQEVARQRLGYIILACLTVLVAAFTPTVDGLLFKYMLSSLEAGKSYLIVIIYAAWWEICNILWRIYDYAALKSYPYIRVTAVSKVTDYVLGHSNSYFQSHHTGNITTKISDVGFSIVTILEIAVSVITRKVIMLIVASTYFFFVHPLLGTIFLLWLLVFFTSIWFSNLRARSYTMKFAESRSSVGGALVDSIGNIFNVRLFSRRRYELHNLDYYLKHNRVCDQKLRIFEAKVNFMRSFMLTVLITLIISCLLYLKRSGLVNAGDFAAIITACIGISGEIWSIDSDINRLNANWGLATQALNVLLKPYGVVNLNEAKNLKINSSCIEFKNVYYNHSDDTPFFKDLNIKIETGQKIGLVGYSGSGKSTFVSLIVRLYDVNQGQILIDGHNVRDVTQESLRNNISFIPQEPALFHRTIRENIRYGRLSANENDIIEAAKLAHAHEFIQHLPHRYHTFAGEKGGKLSGGQRQRIAIARALLKDAPIIILDEATSALDSVTEKLIQDSLHKLMANKTALVIAHRLSTLLYMDRILVFSQGKIVEDGKHDALLASKGLYYKMWESQAGGFLPDK